MPKHHDIASTVRLFNGHRGILRLCQSGRSNPYSFLAETDVYSTLLHTLVNRAARTILIDGHHTIRVTLVLRTQPSIDRMKIYLSHEASFL